MSRQIICMKCAAEHKPKGYPGEWWHREQGKARGFKYGDFVCDMCNETIPRGTDCVAQTLGLDRDPYRPWEADFIGFVGPRSSLPPGIVDGTIRIFNEDGSVEEISPPKVAP